MARFWTKARDESGISLIELLVTMVCMILVLGALMGLLIAAMHQAKNTSARVDARDNAALATEKMQRDLRQTLQILAPTPGSTSTTTVTTNVLTVRMWVNTSTAPAQHSVSFDCSGSGTIPGTFKCLRKDLSTGASKVLIDNVTTAGGKVFSLIPNPSGSTGRSNRS